MDMIDIIPLWVRILFIGVVISVLIFFADRQFVKPWRDLAKERAWIIEKKDTEIKNRDKNIQDMADFFVKETHEENNTVPSTIGNLTTG
ncbi:hypothetical protein PGH07_07735 [Sulfurovum sp. zt1-1]|uniref:Uncharacterized protein n=1 Tax=Sulfurovum zhangzhouensis TaxID=3019067 RepID=A0ABT7QZ04_9BACT|nr:hypothetical protein [Sulfurovum zhangzhouensis]MDM5272067.1 hypothetical protein [Sulfurovum zhangzhouensis]